MPSVARSEIYEANPAGMVIRILEMRGYAFAKDQVERTPAEKLKMTPMIERVFEIQKAILDERNAARENEGDE